MEKAEIVTTADPDVVMEAERIVLPGVGAFADCMAGLTAVPGMVEALREKVLKEGAPVPGHLRRHAVAGHRGRGVRPSCRAGLDRRRSGEDHADDPSNEPALKIPHMGWNELKKVQSHPPCWKACPTARHAYFVHSFQLKPVLPDDLIATTDYGGPLTAMVGNENIAGTQFHPEKSQAIGIQLLENFLALAAHDHFPRHRSEGRRLRAPEERRDGRRHRLQHRSRRPGARLRGPGF